MSYTKYSVFDSLPGNVLTNKRAQRALGRSPEEKVKGQGEVNYIIITKYW